jgi:class 3 adenylate cyclase
MMTEGDSFIVVFHTPQRALAWCVAVQKNLHNAAYSETLLRRFLEVYGALGSPCWQMSVETTKTEAFLHDSIECSATEDSRGCVQGDAFRGMRVRIGLHTGAITSIIKDNKTNRWIYDGPTVRIARALSDAAAGGQILASGETMAALAASESGPDESRENGCATYSMGRHHLAVSLINEGLRTTVRYGAGSDSATAKPSTMDILRKEMLEKGGTAPSRLPTAETVHRCEILYAVPSSLPMRAGYFHRLGSVRQMTPSYFEAPPKEDLTVVFTFIQGSSALEGWDKEVYVEAVAVMKACMRVTLVESGGYEIRETQGNFLLAFRSPTAAAEWCVLSQHALLNLYWDKELLSRPEAARGKEKRETIWCGLRIGMGMCTGMCNSVSPCKRTGRAEYFGHVLNQTARIARCASVGLYKLNTVDP